MTYDIAFLGGGLASSLIARHLKRRHPDLNIIILEQKTSTGFNVGESTVGVAGMFLIRELGLSTYSYLNHLPKNGLRYFFHKADEPFTVDDCSEIGSNILPVFPTYQIDRKRFDSDLWALNREIGIEVLTGATVLNVETGTPHTIEYEYDGKRQAITAGWLINSGGRASRAAPVFNELSPMTNDTDHKTAAAWGRFDNVADIDLMGSEEWKERVGFTARYLSTNHIMGRGYWIWVIPIDGGKVSFGVVYDTEIITDDLSTEEGFKAFLVKEPLIADLLKEAAPLDFIHYDGLACKRKTFSSADKWAIVGDSFGFIDPFYSPGSDIIARQAYLLEHLITAEAEELVERVELINAYMDFEFELIKLLYVGQYGGFGSFEVYNIKSLWDFYSYTCLALWNFYSKKFSDLKWIKGQVFISKMSLAVMRAVQGGFISLSEYLTKEGLYELENHGRFSLRQNRFKIEEDMLSGQYHDGDALHHYRHLCRLSVCELLECRFGIKDLLKNPSAQKALSFEVIAGFKLDDNWLKTYCVEVGRVFAKELSKKNIGEPITVVPEDFAADLPACCASSDDRERIAAAWKSKDWCNTVKSLLLESGQSSESEEAPSLRS